MLDRTSSNGTLPVAVAEGPTLAALQQTSINHFRFCGIPTMSSVAHALQVARRKLKATHQGAAPDRGRILMSTIALFHD